MFLAMFDLSRLRKPRSPKAEGGCVLVRARTESVDDEPHECSPKHPFPCGVPDSSSPPSAFRINRDESSLSSQSVEFGRAEIHHFSLSVDYDIEEPGSHPSLSMGDHVTCEAVDIDSYEATRGPRRTCYELYVEESDRFILFAQTHTVKEVCKEKPKDERTTWICQKLEQVSLQEQRIEALDIFFGIT